jgi:hypothetical protein
MDGSQLPAVVVVAVAAVAVVAVAVEQATEKVAALVVVVAEPVVAAARQTVDEALGADVEVPVASPAVEVVRVVVAVWARVVVSGWAPAATAFARPAARPLTTSKACRASSRPVRIVGPR